MGDAEGGDLATRVQRLEDERGVLRTLHRYAHCIDYGREREWVDCFAEDGVFDVRREDPPGDRYVGHDALAGFVAAHTRAPDHWHKHLVLGPVIEVEGDEARAESYLARLDLMRDEPVIRSFGRYRDRLVRCPDDVWRIRERIAEVEARHPWSRAVPS